MRLPRWLDDLRTGERQRVATESSLSLAKGCELFVNSVRMFRAPIVVVQSDRGAGGGSQALFKVLAESLGVSAELLSTRRLRAVSLPLPVDVVARLESEEGPELLEAIVRTVERW